MVKLFKPEQSEAYMALSIGKYATPDKIDI